MNEKTKENCIDLLYILQASNILRSDILKKLNKRLIKTFCELLLNVLYGSLEINDTEKNVLIKHKKVFTKLSKRSSSWTNKLKLINSLPPDALNVLMQILQKYV